MSVSVVRVSVGECTVSASGALVSVKCMSECEWCISECELLMVSATGISGCE